CALSCKHCNKRYLHGMISCTSPDVLFTTCTKMASKGARGILLSGGYNADGFVPFEPFLDAIARIKSETGLFISAHTGIIPGWLANELGRAGVDQADFDIIGDDETIKFVTGLDKKVEDYRHSIRALEKTLPHIAPHICVGIHGGQLKGELRALELASEINPSVLVLLSFVPTPGTNFEGIRPASASEFGKIVAAASAAMPDSEIALGCMRPRQGRGELELEALRAGADRIELPSVVTIRAAEKMGLQVRRLNACCSIPPELAGDFIA
ncbi:MAG: radical SAM protein, partial [Candidatus Zixiibacteriota bacterium]